MNKLTLNAVFYFFLTGGCIVFGSNNRSLKPQLDNSSILQIFGPPREIEEVIIMNIKQLECSVRQLEKIVDGMANNICHLYQQSDVLDNKLLAQDERITLVEVDIDDTKEDMSVQAETIKGVVCDIDLIKDEIFDLRAKIESRFSLKKATKRSFRLKKATKKLRFILAQSGKSRVLPK